MTVFESIGKICLHIVATSDCFVYRFYEVNKYCAFFNKKKKKNERKLPLKTTGEPDVYNFCIPSNDIFYLFYVYKLENGKYAYAYN